MLALIKNKKNQTICSLQNVTLLRTFCSALTSKRAQLTESGASADGRRREGKTGFAADFAVEEHQTVALSWSRIFLLRQLNTRAHTWRSAAANVR